MALLKKSRKKSVAKKTAPAKPKRARKASGAFQADDPATPDINEAFDLEDQRRVRQRAKFAPKATGTGTRRLGGRLV